jgi:hypothetical protein
MFSCYHAASQIERVSLLRQLWIDDHKCVIEGCYGRRTVLMTNHPIGS